MNRSKRIYLAGPISNMPGHNIAAFNSAADKLREQGFDVVNPVEMQGGDMTMPRAFYMRADIAAILTVDAVAVLPNWQASKGATLEVMIAREIDITVYDADTMEEVPC
jgi:nucleoside 2-deoxyribosyltransferase